MRVLQTTNARVWCAFIDFIEHAHQLYDSFVCATFKDWEEMLKQDHMDETFLDAGALYGSFTRAILKNW